MVRRVLEVEVSRLASRPVVRGLAVFAVALGALVATATAASNTTAYGASVVVKFTSLVAGVVGVIIGGYLGAVMGGEDHELGIGKELHLAGVAGTRASMARFVLAAGVALVTPLLIVGAGLLVAMGEGIARVALGVEAVGVRGGLRYGDLAMVLLAVVCSGVFGLALGTALRSVLAGFAGWMALLLGCFMATPFVAANGALTAIMRATPCAPVLSVVLGPDNIVQRGLRISGAASAITMLAWIVLCGFVCALCSLREPTLPGQTGPRVAIGLAGTTLAFWRW